MFSHGLTLSYKCVTKISFIMLSGTRKFTIDQITKKKITEWMLTPKQTRFISCHYGCQSVREMDF